MKKLLLAVLIFSVLVGAGFAEIGVPLGAYGTSKDEAIKNLTIEFANTMYSATFDSGSVVSVDIQATGGNVRRLFADNISSAYWTIPNGAVYHDHIPVPYAKNTTMWFYAPTGATVPSTIEVLYRYR